MLEKLFQTINKVVKIICSLILTKCLVVLKKECVWEDGRFDILYHLFHFMFDYYKGLTYKRPPF